jgi:hypothetical protein
LAVALVVSLPVAFYVLALPMLKSSAVREVSPSAAMVAILALLLAFAFAAFTLMRKFPAVKVTPEGVIAVRGTGFQSRLVRWGEIERVVFTSSYGVGSLALITNNPFPEQLRMLMHLDEVSALRDFVATHAGMKHPLTLWLSAAQLASNTSLQRARAAQLNR